MPRRITLAALLILSLLSFAVALPAQIRGAFGIRGQVGGPELASLGGIEVLLEKSPNRLVLRTLTDSSGGFEFQNLDPGGYEVIVHVPGYRESRQSVDVGRIADLQTDPEDNQAQDAAASGAGGLDRLTTVYVVVVKERSDGAADPNLAALRRKYPKKVVEEYQKAQEENFKGNTARATQRLEALVKQQPDFYDAYNDLGAIYQKQQRLADARAAFKAAHEIDKEAAFPLVSLGSLYIQEAEANSEKDPDSVGATLDEALDVLEEAIRLEPQAPTAYYLLGAAYYKSSFFTEAEENLKRALELNGTLQPARLILINVYLRQEKWEIALAQLDAYIMENPNSPNAAQVQGIRSKVLQNLGDRR